MVATMTVTEAHKQVLTVESSLLFLVDTRRYDLDQIKAVEASTRAGRSALRLVFADENKESFVLKGPTA